jgi:hypothetical protein
MNVNGDLNVAWRKEWTHEFETPWSIFEKISYANNAERNSILRELGNNHVKNIKALIGDKWREFIFLNGFDKDRLELLMEINLHEQNEISVNRLISFLQDYRVMPYKWFFEHVRWCNECIQSGFHSWFHQFILINKCPYHDCDLLEKCPRCSSQILFLLSNKSLSNPFVCKCGHMLANFSTASWHNWETRYPIRSHSTVKWLEKTADSKYLNEKWLMIPQYSSIELMYGDQTGTLKSIYHTTYSQLKDIKQSKLMEEEYLQQLYNENKKCFMAIDRRIRKNILNEHLHCITQFWEMRNVDRSEFPQICPYAYAYVLWRQAVLKRTYFYRSHYRGDDIDQLTNYSKPFATKRIATELQYLHDQYLKIQLPSNDADELHYLRDQGHRSRYSTEESKDILWILNKVTSQFCMQFFYSWLTIAGQGVLANRGPSSKEVEELTKLSLSKFAFKINKKTNAFSIEYYSDQSENNRGEYTYSCPNSSKQSKRAIKKMKSYVPEQVSMDVFDNPSIENKQFSTYVKQYVGRMRF